MCPSLAAAASSLAACSRLTAPARPLRWNMASANIASRSPRVGGEPVPFGRLLVVAPDAEAVGVKLAQQRHRLDVALLLDPAGRDAEGGKIEAALVGAVSKVGLVRGPRRAPATGAARRRGLCRLAPAGAAAGFGSRLGGGRGRRGRRAGSAPARRRSACLRPGRPPCSPSRLRRAALMPTGSATASRRAASATAPAQPRASLEDPIAERDEVGAGAPQAARPRRASRQIRRTAPRTLPPTTRPAR